MPDLSLTDNLRHVAGGTLHALYAVCMELRADEHGDRQLLGLLCRRLEAQACKGRALEFVTASLDLLEALDDTEDVSLSALAGASDAWDRAASAWSAWEAEARQDALVRSRD